MRHFAARNSFEVLLRKFNVLASIRHLRWWQLERVCLWDINHNVMGICVPIPSCGLHGRPRLVERWLDRGSSLLKSEIGVSWWQKWFQTFFAFEKRFFITNKSSTEKILAFVLVLKQTFWSILLGRCVWCW